MRQPEIGQQLIGEVTAKQHGKETAECQNNAIQSWVGSRIQDSVKGGFETRPYKSRRVMRAECP